MGKSFLRFILTGILLLAVTGCQVFEKPPGIENTQTAILQPVNDTQTVTSQPVTSTPTALPQPVSLPVFGRGEIQDFAWAEDGSSLLTATSLGIYRHDSQTLELEEFIPAPTDLTGDFEFNTSANSIIFHKVDYDQDIDIIGQWDFHRQSPVEAFSPKYGQYVELIPSPDEDLLVALSVLGYSSREHQGLVHLWDLKTGELSRTLVEAYPKESFTSAAFSADGRWLAVGCTDALIYLWDLMNGGETIKLSGHTSNVTTLTFSPDGRMLVSGGADASLRLWEMPDGKLFQAIKEFKGPLQQVEINQDGHWLAASDNTGELRLWPLQADQPRLDTAKTFKIEPYLRKSFAIHPQGDRLAILIENRLQLWDIASEQLLAEDLYYGRLWNSVAWSQDGKNLFGSGRNHIQVWDAQSGAILREIPVDDSGTSDLALSPDGSLLAVTNPYQYPQLEEGVSIIEVQTGNLLCVLKPQDQLNGPPIFSPDSRRLAITYGDKIGIWDPRTGQEVQTIPSASEGYAFSGSSEQLITFDTDWSQSRARIRLWDLAAKTEIQTIWIEGRSDSPLAVTQAKGRSLAAIVLDDGMPPDGPLSQHVEVWDIAQERLLFQVKTSLIEDEQGLTFSPDGSMLAISGYNDLSIVATSNGDTLTTFPYPSSPIQFSPDSNILAAGREVLYRWDITALHKLALEDRSQKTPTPDLRPTRTPTLTSTPQPPLKMTPVTPAPSVPGAIRADNALNLSLYAQMGKGVALNLDWSPDGKRIAVAVSRGVYWYDANGLNEIEFVDIEKVATATNTPDRPASETGMSGRKIQVSPDGQYILDAGTHNLRSKDDVVVFTFPDRENSVNAMVWSADGQQAALGYEDGLVEIWNTADLSQPVKTQIIQVGEWKPRQWPLCFIAPDMQFSPDGQILATVSRDNFLRLWNLENRKLLAEVEGGFQSPRFSPDGERLAVIAASGEILIWQVTSEGGLNLLRTQSEHAREVLSAAFSLDGKQIIAGDRNSFRAWTIDPTPGIPASVHVIRTFDSTSPEFSGMPSVSAIDPVYNQLVSGHIGGMIRVWDGQSGQLVKEFVGSQVFGGLNGFPYIRSIEFSPDGKQIALLGAVGDLNIWDTKSWEKEKVSFCPDAFGLAFSPDGLLLAMAQDSMMIYPDEVCIHETLTGKNLAVFHGKGPLVFSPDGVHLFSDRKWIDLRTVEIIGTFTNSSDTAIKVAAINPSGDVLVLGREDGVIEVWDILNAKPITSLSSGSEQVTVLAFSRDGRLLLAGNLDGTIQVWSIK